MSKVKETNSVRLKVAFTDGWRTWPVRGVTFTGRYRFVNGEMEVELRQSRFFGLINTTVWYREDAFKFQDIHIITCGG